MDSIFVKVFFFASKTLAFRARASLPLSFTSLTFCLICYSCYSCDIRQRVLLLLNENSCHFFDFCKICGLLEDLLYLFFHLKKVKIFAKFVILLILAVYFVSVFCCCCYSNKNSCYFFDFCEICGILQGLLYLFLYKSEILLTLLFLLLLRYLSGWFFLVLLQ